jgi:hypothetical protein
MTPARRIGQDIDIGLERTISDALNQIRNPMSGHVMAGSGLQ